MRLAVGLTCALTAMTCWSYAASAQSPSPEQTRAIAKEAYVYAFPMMEGYQTWRKQAVDDKAPEYVGGFNTFRHYSEPFTPDC